MNIVIITGASSGMGHEFALRMDKIYHHIDEIWLIARRKEKLDKLAEQIKIKTRTIQLDVSDEDSIKQFSWLLSMAKPKIRMLINCAGYGLMGRFLDIPIEEQIGMLRVNCEGLTRMTYECLPYMKKNSRIIQLASSAAFLPQNNFTVYAASKAYVLSFSRALREELKNRKIYVTAVCPGPVKTEFFDRAEKYGTTLSIKKMTEVSVECVVTDALRASAAKRAMSVCSIPIRAFWVLTKILPNDVIFAAMELLKIYQKKKDRK